MNVQDVIIRFTLEFKKILGNNLSKVILYGSYARGDAHETSDVDIMVLVTLSDDEIRKIRNEVYDCAFELEMEHSVDISPIIKNKDHYEYWLDTLPFYQSVENEGVIVA